MVASATRLLHAKLVKKMLKKRPLKSSQALEIFAPLLTNIASSLQNKHFFRVFQTFLQFYGPTLKLLNE